MLRIMDSVYAVEGLQLGRVYVLVGSDGLTLIDCSLPGSEKKIAAELTTIGHTIKDVHRILITHAHYDHIGSLAALQRMSQAEVYVHHLDANVARGLELQPRPDPATLPLASKLLARLSASGIGPEGAQVDHELEDGSQLDQVMPGMQAFHMPGHSPGHVVYWLPSHKLLFCGDIVMHLFGLRLPIRAFTPDMLAERRSLRKLATLEPLILCPGHGAPLTKQAAEQLHQCAATYGA